MSAAERVAQLEAEAAQLREAIRARPRVDIARGALMATHGCSAAEAWTILVHVSQHSNIKLRDIAAAITADLTGGDRLPEHLRPHLDAALTAWRSRLAAPAGNGDAGLPQAQRTDSQAQRTDSLR
ncbi:ANTAR domain-containing protein [Streptomyces sp. NPDC004111]|uniref:ANTAR domain-containing protein n=1 Tax=Streptomyces sp. NPDC004111 TaxID=3364690 RepID=UPI0036AAB631